MTLFKQGLVFLVAWSATSVLTIGVVTLWAISSGPTSQVFLSSSFECKILPNRTYYIMVGTLGQEKPQPNYGAIDVLVHCSDHGNSSNCHLNKEKGSLELEFWDKNHGDIKAVSVAALEVKSESQAHIDVKGWQDPKAIYVVDYGFLSFMVPMLFAFIGSLVLAFVILCFVKRFSKQKGVAH